MPKAGIVTVVGKPNAGKSTLLNRIVGQKLSIVSPKPQSTRDRIVGIHTSEDVQFIILDTPGLLNPRYALQESMRATALAALADADVILYLIDGSEDKVESLESVAALEQLPRAHVIVGINKVDVIPKPRYEQLVERARDATGAADVRLLSAVTGEGIEDLLAAVGALLPESPFLYPEDDISTQTVRFFVRELIRETALEQLSDEVPYSVACEIEEFREGQTPVYIRAVLHVERESQKGILIGAGAKRIREIGRVARTKIEALVGSSVYLDLRVKVLPNWRRNANALNRFGYKLPGENAS
ncbi:MAG TPA: GTPase Era [Gemmatimonadaceae bacterium]|jgi:GTP-binding protein Era